MPCAQCQSNDGTPFETNWGINFIVKILTFFQLFLSSNAIILKHYALRMKFWHKWKNQWINITINHGHHAWSNKRNRQKRLSDQTKNANQRNMCKFQSFKNNIDVVCMLMNLCYTIDHFLPVFHVSALNKFDTKL